MKQNEGKPVEARTVLPPAAPLPMTNERPLQPVKVLQVDGRRIPVFRRLPRKTCATIRHAA